MRKNLRPIKFLDLQKINRKPFIKFIIALIRYYRNQNYFINGQAKLNFEKQLCYYTQSKFSLGVGNGLDALTIGLKAAIDCGYLKLGQKILVQNNTFIATYNAVILAGLEPVLFDIDLESLRPTAKILQNIPGTYQGIIITHLYGIPNVNEEILELIKKKKWILIEDCAQSIGAKMNNHNCGSFGLFSAYSFYPGKNLGGIGDGGAICTDDNDIFQTSKIISNYGSSEKYIHNKLGVNSRLDDIQAIFLTQKLQILDQENSIRREQAELYDTLIQNPLISIPFKEKNFESVYHLYVIRVLKNRRESLKNYLKGKNIDTLIHYPITVSKQSWVNKSQVSILQNSEKAANEIISLPIGSHLSQNDIKYIITSINSFRA